MRAAATTPAEPSGARVARFPAGGSLPRKTGGSASASYVSRPAQRSLALRPAWSLGRPWRPVPSECFRPCRCLHHPLRLLPAGATVAGRDSHPLGSGAFPRRTVSSVLHRHARGKSGDRRTCTGDGQEAPGDALGTTGIRKTAHRAGEYTRSAFLLSAIVVVRGAGAHSRVLKGRCWRGLQRAASGVRKPRPPGRQRHEIGRVCDGGNDAGEPGRVEPSRRVSGGTWRHEPGRSCPAK